MIDYLEKLDRYIAKDNLEIALDDFLEMLLVARKKAPQAEAEIQEIKTRVIVLSSQLHDLKKQKQLGTIEANQAFTIKNQIIFKVSELLAEISNYTEFYSFLQTRDEENNWLSAVNFNTLNATEAYIEKYPNGKYIHEATHLLYELNKIHEQERNRDRGSINQIVNENFNNLSDIEWWNILSPPWKKIFRAKLKISESPTDEDFVNLFNIERLAIHGNREIRSIEPLKKMKKLKYLDISDTRIAYLNTLKCLENLEVIWFSYTAISDLSPLKNSTNLIELDFSNSEVEDLTPISDLPNLERINCTLTNVSSIYPIYDMRKLKSLNCNTHLLSIENIDNYKLMNQKVEVNLY